MWAKEYGLREVGNLNDVVSSGGDQAPAYEDNIRQLIEVSQLSNGVQDEDLR